jgi:hypothetical protein
MNWKEYKSFLEEKLKVALQELQHDEQKYYESKIAYEAIQKQVDSIEIRKCPVCGEYFNKIKRQQYCSDACKQEAYRLRKEENNKAGNKK